MFVSGRGRCNDHSWQGSDGALLVVMGGQLKRGRADTARPCSDSLFFPSTPRLVSPAVALISFSTPLYSLLAGRSPTSIALYSAFSRVLYLASAFGPTASIRFRQPARLTLLHLTTLTLSVRHADPTTSPSFNAPSPRSSSSFHSVPSACL